MEYGYGDWFFGSRRTARRQYNLRSQMTWVEFIALGRE